MYRQMHHVIYMGKGTIPHGQSYHAICRQRHHASQASAIRLSRSLDHCFSRFCGCAKLWIAFHIQIWVFCLKFSWCNNSSMQAKYSPTVIWKWIEKYFMFGWQARPAIKASGGKRQIRKYISRHIVTHCKGFELSQYLRPDHILFSCSWYWQYNANEVKYVYKRELSWVTVLSTNNDLPLYTKFQGCI